MLLDNLLPGLMSGLLALAGIFLGGFLQSRRERKAAQRTASSPSPPTTQEVWQRLDALEKVVRSSVVLLGEVADQWVGEHPPILSKRHVSVLAEAGYMPPEWDPPVEDTEQVRRRTAK